MGTGGRGLSWPSPSRATAITITTSFLASNQSAGFTGENQIQDPSPFVLSLHSCAFISVIPLEQNLNCLLIWAVNCPITLQAGAQIAVRILLHLAAPIPHPNLCVVSSYSRSVWSIFAFRCHFFFHLKAMQSTLPKSSFPILISSFISSSMQTPFQRLHTSLLLFFFNFLKLN